VHTPGRFCFSVPEIFRQRTNQQRNNATTREIMPNLSNDKIDDKNDKIDDKNDKIARSARPEHLGHDGDPSADSPGPRYMEAAARMGLIHAGAFAGVVYWQPPGLRLYEKLRSYIRRHHEDAGYQEVKSPSLVGLSAFSQSGHVANYLQNMFVANQVPGDGMELSGYALRPMSCPNHIELYGSVRRSYRELPVKFFEFGEVFRNEPSGSLQVLFRQRQFCQDDSHVFCAQEDVAVVLADYLGMAGRVFTELGFSSVEYAISLRPNERFGDDALWDQAEEALRDGCRRAAVNWREQPGEGAFYGPKIELAVRDRLGRPWQMGTLQLDYVLPERFDLRYQAADGSQMRPVLLHHAVLGSLERMIGVLLEVHGVDLPEFLHPWPAVVIPVSEKSLGYANEIARILESRGLFAPVESGDEPVSGKIRSWSLRGAREIFVVGEREANEYSRHGRMLASVRSARSKAPGKEGAGPVQQVVDLLDVEGDRPPEVER
jgi:threonyl-tRNA synthetase